jgi:hypothetical protein
VSEWLFKRNSNPVGLSHKRARALIQQAHLSSLERNALGEHLSGCNECGRYAATHVYVSRHLQLEPIRSAISAKLRASLLSRVRSQHRRGAIMKPIYAFAGVVVLAIIVVGAWLTFSSLSQEDVSSEALSPTETPLSPTVEPTIAPPEDSAAEAVPPTVEPPAEAEVAQAYLKYDIGDAVHGLAVADLNGDALPDIAVPDHISGLTTILMNDGHGAFQEAGSYETGESSTGISAADFNGDSYLDLAISQDDSETISILINEGAGTFQAPVFYAAGPTPEYVQSGDMNGDSFIDLVVIHAPDLVGLLFNNGDGTFGEIVQYFVGSRAGYGSAHPVDVDGDGHLDVAVRHMPNALVSILMNQGDGTLAEPIEYEACFNTSSGIAHPWLTAGDLNQDGALDLLVPCESGIVSILLNSGDGSFQETIHLESGGKTKDVRLAELNGDGLPDLLVATTSTGLMTSYANLGDGAFQPLKDYPYTDYGFYGIDELNIVDVEGDGLLDVIVQSGSAIYIIPIEGAE